MENKILLWIIPLVGVILITPVNYTFAAYNDQLDNDINNKEEKHHNIKNNDCDTKFECNTTSLEQLNNQDNQCEGNAKCTNESFSNIVLCKDNSLCIFQYEGPFELLNPY
jgi:hypothetical protein